jgi:hypothetical protein
MRMIMNGEKVQIWKEVMAYVKVISWHSPEGNEKGKTASTLLKFSSSNTNLQHY